MHPVKFEIISKIPAERHFYQYLSAILTSELILHSGHSEQHLGLCDDLKFAVAYLHAHQLYLTGIHQSCQSKKHAPPATPHQPVAITCIMFQKKQTHGEFRDYRYHLGYIGDGAEETTLVLSTLSHIYREQYHQELQWSHRRGTAYFVEAIRQATQVS